MFSHFPSNRALAAKKLGIPAPASSAPQARDDGSYLLPVQKSHPVPTTIRHWQLRDVISSPLPNTVVHPHENALHFYDTKNGADSHVLADLPFEPTSLDTGYGYVALAGARGMAMVHETSTGWSASFNSGPGMNNSIRLSRHQNEIRVTVCNNDHTIKVYRVPSMEKLFTLNMPTAINHTAMSPDGTKMLAASDGGDVYVYDVQGAGEYKLLATYKASSEPALSCAWNQSSEIFAVTSQDGFINVWNIHGEKLCQLGSTEGRKTRRAARAVQFSKGPLDLLAYSEHVSTVNIIDTRTFKSRQVVRLAPSDMDYHIAGMTFSPDNQSLFVALEKSLVELKVDVSARRQFPSHRIHLF